MRRLTLCELSAALPRSGGDYVFLSEAYGPLAGFLSGWVSFLIGFGGPIAASAFGAAKYLLAPLRLDDARAAIAQPAVASAAIVWLGVVHCLGRRSTIRAQAGMTALRSASSSCWRSSAWRPAGAAGKTSPTGRR